MSEPSSTDLSQLTGCLSVNDEGSVAQQTNGEPEPTKLEDGEVGLLQVAGWVFVKIGTFYFSL